VGLAANVTFQWEMTPLPDGNPNNLPVATGVAIYQSSTSGQYTFGQASPNLKATVATPNNTATITGVPIGKFYWVATTYNAEVESAPSNEASLEITLTGPQNFKIILFTETTTSVKTTSSVPE
jgi:hypothetical protein